MVPDEGTCVYSVETVVTIVNLELVSPDNIPVFSECLGCMSECVPVAPGNSVLVNSIDVTCVT